MLKRGLRLFGRLGLPERLLAVLMLVIVIEMAANTFLFERVSSFELRQDDAERIAENLLLASRVIDNAEPRDRHRVAARLSSPRFSLTWAEEMKRSRGSLALSTLRSQIIEIEPGLMPGDLELHLEELPGKGNVGGSLLLSDKTILKFHTHVTDVWSLTVGRIASHVVPALLLIVLAFILLRAVLGPLRTLIGATREVGSGPPSPLPEQGPDEMRALIRALNDMQERIHQLFADRTQTMLAIGHDLKTPLSRMRLRLDDAGIDTELRESISHDIDEMRMLIESIQAYVDSGGEALQTERIDIAAMTETLVDKATDQGGKVTFQGDYGIIVRARPIAIRRALSNLIENAIHYGGTARVYVRRDGDGAEIVVEDDGPGIPEDRIGDALQPFVRLDTARTRDTAGMGLGLPIVQRAVRMENGTLDLRNRSEGGLRATIRLPLSAN